MDTVRLAAYRWKNRLLAGKDIVRSLENSNPGKQLPRIQDEGKERQRARLDAYVHQMLKGEQDLAGVVVAGYPGIGKTYLVENYLKQYEGWYPILTAYHHHQHSDIPYFGLKQAIPEFLGKTYNLLPRHEFRKFALRLRNWFGPTFPLLLEYIPEVSRIIGNDRESRQKYTPQIENQLFAVFNTFFSFLSDYYKQPVLFFTDDLQWIDPSGVDLLKYLLIQLSPEKLVWIAASREVPHNVPHQSLVEELGWKQKRVEIIRMRNFTREEVHAVMEESLQMPCSTVLGVVCYNLCGGNPSALQVLLESLRNNGLIWEEAGQWQGNPDTISQHYKGQRTERILFERLQQLSAPAQELLLFMACLGGFNRRVLVDWRAQRTPTLPQLLDEAIQAGFLMKDQNTFRFTEKHIRELIYEYLPVLKKSRVHYRIASLLYAIGTDHLNATQIVLMTTQFNQCLELVRAKKQQLLCAELNYLAGQYSVQDNALNQAQYFFKTSADLLKECPWQTTTAQLHKVYTELARAAYQLGEYDLAEIHLDYLLEHITDAIERASVFELKVVINSHLGRYRKGVHILKECLRELGLELPLEDQALHQEVARLKALLQVPQTPSGRQAHATMGQFLATEKAILQLLYVGGMSLHHTSDVLMTWAALQIITRSGNELASGEMAIGC